MITGVVPWSLTVAWPTEFVAYIDGLNQAPAAYYYLKRTYQPRSHFKTLREAILRQAIRSVGFTPAFLAYANTVSPQRALYYDRGIFWLGPNETGRISIQVLWQGATPPHKAALKVGFWNTAIWKTNLPVSDVAPR